MARRKRDGTAPGRSARRELTTERTTQREYLRLLLLEYTHHEPFRSEFEELFATHVGTLDALRLQPAPGAFQHPRLDRVDDWLWLERTGLSEIESLRRFWSAVAPLFAAQTGPSALQAAIDAFTERWGLRARWATAAMLVALLRHRERLASPIPGGDISAWPAGSSIEQERTPEIRVILWWDPAVETRAHALERGTLALLEQFDAVERSYLDRGYHTEPPRQFELEARALFRRLSAPERWTWSALAAAWDTPGDRAPRSLNSARDAVRRAATILELELPAIAPGRPRRGATGRTGA